MIIYVNSSARNQGQSTFAYTLAKIYGNMSNQSTILISLRDDSFMRTVTRLPEAYEFVSIEQIIQKSSVRGNFMASTYKLEGNLFYYNAKGATLNNQISIKSIEDMLTKAKLDFGMVIVDADISVNNFYNFVHLIDKLVLVVTPNIIALRYMCDSFEKISEKYETAKSQRIPCDIFFILSKYDETLSLSEVYKELGGNSNNIFPIAYNHKLAKQHNKGLIDEYITDILIDTKSVDRKFLINFREAIKKITGFRLPSRKIEVKPSSQKGKGIWR